MLSVVHCICSNISLKMSLQLYNCTLHLFRDQPEDGPTNVQLYTTPVQRSAWRWPYKCTVVHYTCSEISLKMALQLYSYTIVHSTCSNISLKMALQMYSCTLHLFKYQSEDVPTVVQLYTTPFQRSAWRWPYNCTIVHSTCSKISLKMALQLYNCTLHLFKDQPEDGPTIVQLYTAPFQISAWRWPYKCTVVHYTCSEISLKMALQMYSCTLHLFRDQPEDGLTIVQLYTPPVQSLKMALQLGRNM